MVLMNSQRLFGLRDPHGFRPLCLGRLGPSRDARGLGPGLGDAGPQHHRRHLRTRGRARRAHRHRRARTAQPRGALAAAGRAPSSASSSSPTSPGPTAGSTGVRCTRSRCRMGELLAAQAPAEADMVMGVPESGVPGRRRLRPGQRHPLRAGAGEEPLHRSVVHRPGPEGAGGRGAAQAEPAHRAIAGKRLVVVDDSIVRGTTQRSVIRMLREAGAAEVHLRISSPPWRWPCFYGIDTPSVDELLATDHTVEEMAAILGADSLAYISIENLRRGHRGPTAASATPASPATTPPRCRARSTPVTIRGRLRPWPTRPRSPESERSCPTAGPPTRRPASTSRPAMPRSSDSAPWWPASAGSAASSPST